MAHRRTKARTSAKKAVKRTAKRKTLASRLKSLFAAGKKKSARKATSK